MTTEKEKRPQGGEGAGNEHAKNYSTEAFERCAPGHIPLISYETTDENESENGENSNDEQPAHKLQKITHMTIVRAMLDQGEFCMLDGQPSCIVNGKRVFGWYGVHDAMLAAFVECTEDKRNEACKTLEHIAPKRKLADARYIEFENGVFDVKANRFVDGIPRNQVIPYPIPHEYDPEAPRCEYVDALLDGMADGRPEIRLNLEEIIGLSLSRFTDENARAAWMYGTGGNGKSTYKRMLSNLVGADHVSALKPGAIMQKHALTVVVGKLVNFADDVEATALNQYNVETFKNLVKGDPVTIEQKYRDPFDASFFANWIITSNSLPKLTDTTRGAKRRLHYIPLTASFDSKEKRISDLDKKLSTEKAAKYAIRLGIEGLRRVMKYENFTLSKYSEDAKADAIKRGNTIAAFLSEHEREEFRTEDSIKVWFMRYKTWCDESGENPEPQKTFTQAVNEHFGFERKTDRKNTEARHNAEREAAGLTVNQAYGRFVPKKSA